MATMTVKKAMILALLDKSDAAVIKAITTIYDRQTADEKASHTTSHLNAKGFSANDADFGTSLGSKIKKGYTMTPKQIAAGRRMIKHYWKQLVEVADSKNPGWADKDEPTVAQKVEEEKAEFVAAMEAEGNADAEWIKMKNEFGKVEAEQERQAFQYKMDLGLAGMGF